MGGCFLLGMSQNGRNHERNATARHIIQNVGIGKGDRMNVSRQPGDQPGCQMAQQQTRWELEEEARKIRRLQVMMGMVMSVIGQDPNLTLEEASELAAGAPGWS